MDKIYIVLRRADAKSQILLGSMEKYQKNIFIVNNLPCDNNALYLINKHILPDEQKTIRKLRARGNIFIYQLFDYNCGMSKKEKFADNYDNYVNDLINQCKHVNYVLFNSYYHSKIIPFENKLVMYHEYDNRIKKSDENDRKDSINYFGIKTKCSLSQEIIDKYNINIKIERFNLKIHRTIHIDFCLKDNLYYSMHTSTKCANAIGADCVFICNRLPIYVELLGENYNLFINDDYSNIETIINTAKNIINNNKQYKKYIKSLKHLKKELSTKNILDQYLELFKIKN